MFDPGSKPAEGWRRRVYEIIFETERRSGRLFDVSLLGLIILSIVVVSLETVPTIDPRLDRALVVLEYTLTVLFTIEYILRAVSVNEPRRYIFSAMGIIDLLAVLPTYFTFFFPGAASFGVVRVLRLLRVFRVLRLRHYVREGDYLLRTLIAARVRITVFVGALLIIVAIQGALLYVVEGPENGFDSIPRGMYWAVVTLTTVGYGDISPQTALGQAIAATVMILGYGIIAVPTGIVTAQFVRQVGPASAAWNPQVCGACRATENRGDAAYCRVCGHALGAKKQDPPPA